jgi:xanthine dehydrogenase iron-sulfur cluster and FAD-binding subunit A
MLVYYTAAMDIPAKIQIDGKPITDRQASHLYRALMAFQILLERKEAKDLYGDDRIREQRDDLREVERLMFRR